MSKIPTPRPEALAWWGRLGGTRLGLTCALLSLLQCGGGGSSSSSTKTGQLLAIQFPDPGGVNPQSRNVPPVAAPLNQQVVFEFSESPNPSQVGFETIPIRDTRGVLASGQFRVEGARVIFTPDFPRRPLQMVADKVVDSGGAGLVPLERYSVRIGPDTWPQFIESIDKQVLAKHSAAGNEASVELVFSTTGVESQFFAGIEGRRPRLLESNPSDGAVGVTPQLYGDPEALFEPRRGFTLRFDGPVLPTIENLAAFRLVDLEDRTLSAAGLELGIEVDLLRNDEQSAIVEIRPSGILPFDHLLSLEYPLELKGLGEGGVPASDTRVAATFTVAPAPASVRDVVMEHFDDARHQNRDPAELGTGQIPAAWDVLDSNLLTANLAFEGRGELGAFRPPNGTSRDPRLVILDTSVQTFPLLDGSTPDAPPGVQVVGGVFAFTDIDIPEHVTLQPRGPNPMILTATGTVRIAGSILMNGVPGRDENAFDSAVTALPGGAAAPGGGRGGEGHPAVFVGAVNRRNLVTPVRAGDGWGPGNLQRIGGGGGTSGSLDNPDENGAYQTDRESTCNESGNNHNPGYRPGGGGGGSLFRLGLIPRAQGIGNVLPDGAGNYIVRTPQSHGDDYNVLPGGAPGRAVFADESDGNDFFGLRGEVQRVVGGQGGGGGGTGMDSYYCGAWCRKDSDPTNNGICKAEFGQGGATADSVGDSRGGSGGGGGGAFWIKALGDIVLTSTAFIQCNGGAGGGGEQLGCGSFAGCGGGGAGGAALFQSGRSILVQDGAVVEVLGGRGGPATRDPGGCNRSINHPSAGGNGGAGIIQFQVPVGQLANVENSSLITRASWVDKPNTRNPAEFTPVSVALSNWYDFGRVIDRPPKGTNPVYSFRGLDPETGRVLTDAFGNVQDPGKADIRVDFLGVADPANPGQFLPGLQPRANAIPPNASVTVEFEGADAVRPGSKEIDPESLTGWGPSPSVANGKQFLRYRITFDVTAREGDELHPDTPRPTVQSLSIRAEF